MVNDIYEIGGRVKNHIAREDIAISPVGEVLVNYYTLMLKELYDFTLTLSLADRSRLELLLNKNENIPMLIIKVATEKQEKMLEQENSLVREDVPHGIDAFENNDTRNYPGALELWRLAGEDAEE
jgi:hypothetical protein